MTDVSSPPEYARTTFFTLSFAFTSLPFSLLHLSEEEKLHQRLLGVQPVLGLVPDHALRPVDHLGGDLLAAVRGQAVHEKRVLLRHFHHGGVDLPILEVALALLVFRLE